MLPIHLIAILAGLVLSKGKAVAPGVVSKGKVVIPGVESRGGFSGFLDDLFGKPIEGRSYVQVANGVSIGGVVKPTFSEAFAVKDAQETIMASKAVVSGERVRGVATPGGFYTGKARYVR